MPPKAYDRVKNANQQSDLFVKTPYWTPEIEERFQSWHPKIDAEGLLRLIDEYLLSGISVSLKMLDASVCCTLAHQARREGSLTCLLTGWSDNAGDALLVAHFKLMVLLDGSWDGLDPAVKVPRR
jgi:hypothetical protein